MFAPVYTFRLRILAVTTLRNCAFAVRIFAFATLAICDTFSHEVFVPVYTFRFKILAVTAFRYWVLAVRMFAFATFARVVTER